MSEKAAEVIASKSFQGIHIDPLGVPWYSRRLTDPQYETKPPPEVDPGEDYKIAWPRLKKLRSLVKDHTAPKVPGRVRCLKIKVKVQTGKRLIERKVKVDHSEDVKENAKPPSFKDAYTAADRQTDDRGRLIVSRRIVAKVLGLSMSGVRKLEADGILWMPEQDGEPYQPELILTKYGHYGREEVPFWVEEELNRIKAVWDALSRKPADGQITVKTATTTNKLNHQTTKKLSRDYVTIKLTRKENRNGEQRTVAYPYRQAVIPGDEITDHVESRLQIQRPPNTLTTEETANLLKMHEWKIWRLFPGSVRRLGQIICSFKKRYNGKWKKVTQVKTGKFYIPVVKVKREFETRFEGQRFPELEGRNGHPPAPSEGKAGGGFKDPKTEEVYRFCYVEFRLKDRKRSRVREHAEKDFGHRAPKGDYNVTVYADRYAVRKGHPKEPSPEQIPALLSLLSPECSKQ
jgi:hypothetical protein